MRGSLAQKEPELLARWRDMELYARQRETAKGRKKFLLHDGPPYANGSIHIGHALNKILKDVVNRAYYGLGHDTAYIPGLGLPRASDRMEGRRKLPRQGQGQRPDSHAAVSRRVPRFRRALAQGAVGRISAPRRSRRLEPSLFDHDSRRRKRKSCARSTSFC